MKILNDYIVIEKIKGADIYLTPLQTDAYQRAKVVHTNEESLTKVGDTLLLGDAIFFDRARCFDEEYYFIYESQVFGIIREGKIIPMNNIVYIKTDKYRNETKGDDDFKLYNDISYNPLNIGNVVQDGEVLSVCKKANDSYFDRPLEIEIAPGDKVYAHHFLTDEGAERIFNGETYYEMIYENIYCKIVQGKIVMVNDWNFITPIPDDEANERDGIILTTEKVKVAQTGVVEVANKNLGVKVGAKILFKRNRDYEMIVEGKVYYRIKNDDIIYEL